MSAESSVAHGTFAIDLRPVADLDPETIGRFEFTKTIAGDLMGSSRGVMLSAGDPSTGRAGYVVIEVWTGELAGRRGSFALQHSGTMADGDSSTSIVVTPGSGTDDLAGITGEFSIDGADDDGTHHWTLTYTLERSA